MKNKRNLFTMVELLVGMAVLAIMMTFLMKAFTSASSLSSSGNKSIESFERSLLLLDFISGDIGQLSVNDLSRIKLGFKYTSTSTSASCEFSCRQPFSDQPVDLKRIQYAFSSNTLTRQIDTGDVETLMDGIEEFSIEFFDKSDTGFAQNTDIYTYPSYCQLTMKFLQDTGSGTENTQRSFTRRIYFD